MTIRELRVVEPVYAPMLHAGTIIKVEEPTPVAQPTMMEYDPVEVTQWLFARGWSTQHYKTGAVSRYAYQNETLKTFDMSWEQAVAYEMFRFLNMGTR